jgi:hypothetical protein
MDKSFFVLFFKKELLSSCWIQQRHQAVELVQVAVADGD